MFILTIHSTLKEQFILRSFPNIDFIKKSVKEIFNLILQGEVNSLERFKYMDSYFNIC